MTAQSANGYAPEPQPEPGWIPLEMPGVFTERCSFLSDGPENNRVRIAYYRRETDKHVLAQVWFGPGAEGPPGHAHGGSIAAVLDEAMGLAVWVDGHPALAASLNVRFRVKIPIGTDTTVEAWVQKVNGKRVATRSHVTDPKSGICLAEAEALLITLSPERQRDILYPGFDA